MLILKQLHITDYYKMLSTNKNGNDTYNAKII